MFLFCFLGLPIPEGLNHFENPFRQSPLPSQDSQNSPGLTTVLPPNLDKHSPGLTPVLSPSHFGDRSEIVFQENIPIFQENQLNNNHHHDRLKDFSTPIPFTRKPYPKEVKQLTQLPGIPIPLKQHGPFKVLQRPTFRETTFRDPTFHSSTFHSTTFPTTTLSPSFVSTLPPRINVTPAPISETVISTTFSANRFEASPYGPSHQVNKAFINLL
jgi:hypothetical protein